MLVAGYGICTENAPRHMGLVEAKAGVPDCVFCSLPWSPHRATSWSKKLTRSSKLPILKMVVSLKVVSLKVVSLKVFKNESDLEKHKRVTIVGIERWSGRTWLGR